MKYYSIESTPLKWHTFYRYVTMPLGVITGIINLIGFITTMDNLFYLIDIAFMLVQTACCAAAFVGFFRWKSYAWYAVMINLACIVVYEIIGLIVTVFSAGDVAYSIGSVIGSTAVSILIAVYYNKRKPLFFGTPAPAEEAACGLPVRIAPEDAGSDQ